MRVLVTGATGFVGRHTVSALVDAGHEVVALYRRSKPTSTGAVRWVQSDLSDGDWSELTRGLEGVEGLIHLAASGVDSRSSTWADCFDVNVTSTIRLWTFAIQNGVNRIVNIGSCFEYGAAADRHWLIPVSAAPEPMNAYAASKAAATMALHGVAASHGVRAITLRPCVVFGEGESEYRLWPSLRRAAFAGADFPMTTGEQVRDFVPVEVVAARLCEALTREDLTPGHLLVENVGSGKPQSVREFARYWWGHWGASGKLLFGAVASRPSECLRIAPKLKDGGEE